MSEQCPHCATPLSVIGSGWHCNTCGRDYIDERVPVNGATKAEVAESTNIDNQIAKTFGRFARK